MITMCLGFACMLVQGENLLTVYVLCSEVQVLVSLVFW